LDVRLADNDGLSVLESLRAEAPNSRIIVFSNFDNPTYVARAQALGATDYILKDAPREEMLATIQAAAAGTGPTSSGQLRRVAETMALRNKDASNEMSLTQRETQVLRHLALGLSNKEIGLSLSISIETVKEHVQHLLRKMGVNDRTQAAVWAVKRGLV
jgi:DNA-binding NarL/FixJ family response regulator